MLLLFNYFLGFSDAECESQKNLMMAKLSSLEQEAYALAGHPFSLTSTDDISQVFIHLQFVLVAIYNNNKSIQNLGEHVWQSN